MNKKVITLICLSLIIISFFSFKGFANKEVEKTSILGLDNSTSADKIEVVHFHGTHQCWSCITVGEYALATIKNKFSEEYQSGKIVFKDINSELPENKEIVTKYQARSSSLFINAITGNEDNIEEDITVWRLVSNEQRFTDYFENKLRTLLGK